MNHWYKRILSEDELFYCKEERARIDAIMKKNVLTPKNDRRWVGEAGEYGFECMLEDCYNYTHGVDFIHHNKENPFDDLDFTVKHMKIDVKTQSSNTIPKEHYRLNLTAKQAEHKKHPKNKVNTLVFARMTLPEDAVFIFGWISKHDFLNQATFHREGEQVGKITATCDFYDVPISDLNRFKNVY